MAQKVEDISAYIASLPVKFQPMAEGLRQAIRSSAPQCTEDVKYGMPTFKIDGTSIIYFAVWKNHVGLYPIYKGSSEFEREIAPHRAKKDTVQFSLKEPIRHDLIARIVKSQVLNLQQRQSEPLGTEPPTRVQGSRSR